MGDFHENEFYHAGDAWKKKNNHQEHQEREGEEEKATPWCSWCLGGKRMFFFGVLADGGERCWSDT
jgi:hypothetical protein